jgi:predicted metal-dependent peptidase
MTDFQQRITAIRLRLSQRSPYFASLALQTRIEASEQVPTAATDGRAVYVNPAFFSPQTPAAQEGLILHEILHAALLHVARRSGRDAKVWNIAADIVVNGVLLRNGFDIPDGGIVDRRLEQQSVEAIYDHLVQQAKTEEQKQQLRPDLLEAGPGEAGQPMSAAEAEKLEAEWRLARDQAESANQGELPAGMAREAEVLQQPKLDWRQHLWRFLTRTPVDFEEFDRRFVGQGLYLETISGQSVQVLVCIDTSGSIDRGLLTTFVSELQGILLSYPGLKCDLFFADRKLHGPYPLQPGDPAPKPIGGGGTDFRPFFAYAQQHYDDWTAKVAVYLTDGYGNFPTPAPHLPTLWVVTPRGKALNTFPFGEAVRVG